MTGRVDESVAYSSYVVRRPGHARHAQLPRRAREAARAPRRLGGLPRAPRARRRDPLAPPAGRRSRPASRTALDKNPPLVPTRANAPTRRRSARRSRSTSTTSARSGGCQQSVGDFLYHCHIAHHYFAGMWGIWRVYNTLQDGPRRPMRCRRFRVLPERERRRGARGRRARARRHDRRLARQHDADHQGNVAGMGRAQLPPPGAPKGYDASVWDWQRDGDRYLGEPETAAAWPGYRVAPAGSTAELLLRPAHRQARLPVPQPHLGAAAAVRARTTARRRTSTRPTPERTDHRAGRQRAGQRVPAGTKLKQFAINAIDAAGAAEREGQPRRPRRRALRAARAGGRGPGRPVAAGAAGDPRQRGRGLRRRPPAQRARRQRRARRSARSACTSTSCSSTCRRATVSTPASTTSRRCGRSATTGALADRTRGGGRHDVIVGDARASRAGAVVGVGVDQDTSFEAAAHRVDRRHDAHVRPRRCSTRTAPARS